MYSRDHQDFPLVMEILNWCGENRQVLHQKKQNITFFGVVTADLFKEMKSRGYGDDVPAVWKTIRGLIGGQSAIIGTPYPGRPGMLSCQEVPEYADLLAAVVSLAEEDEIPGKLAISREAMVPPEMWAAILRNVREGDGLLLFVPDAGHKRIKGFPRWAA